MLVEHGETWEDRGEKGWRRVVASPEPLEILDAPAVHALVEAGFVVVANGGGGIPVVRDADGTLRGVEAVIDKDLGAALLARTVEADVLVIATDVPQRRAALRHARGRADSAGSPSASCAAYAAEGHFASGSMGPKVDAVCRFVETRRQPAVITSLDHIADAVAGDAGTVVVPDTDTTSNRKEHRMPERHRSTQGPHPLRRRRQRAREADRRRRDGRRPGHRDHRQDRGQRRRQRLHPDHRRPRVPRGAGRQGRARPSRSSRSRSSGPAAPTA